VVLPAIGVSLVNRYFSQGRPHLSTLRRIVQVSVASCDAAHIGKKVIEAFEVGVLVFTFDKFVIVVR